jgi:hypothetical protein
MEIYMKYNDYPALFKSADAASNAFQKNFLRLIKFEYGLLILAAALAVPKVSNATWYVATAFVLVLSVAVLLVRSIWKPEQHWYRARALSESVKTLAWRYSMGAHPFDHKSTAKNRLELKESLSRLVTLNAETVERLTSDAAADEQVTAEMDRLCALPLVERLAYYQQHRVQEQRRWYKNKSAENKKIALRWVVASVIGYVLAIALSLTRIAAPDWEFWPIEPLIVIAGSILGWVQIKKFNELAASYGVTAQEIGMIKITLQNDISLKNFSDFVNEAESAFSREHTSWLARQTN